MVFSGWLTSGSYHVFRSEHGYADVGGNFTFNLCKDSSSVAEVKTADGKVIGEFVC